MAGTVELLLRILHQLQRYYLFTVEGLLHLDLPGKGLGQVKMLVGGDALHLLEEGLQKVIPLQPFPVEQHSLVSVAGSIDHLCELGCCVCVRRSKFLLHHSKPTVHCTPTEYGQQS